MLRHLVEYALLRFLLAVFRPFPLSFLAGFGRGFGRFLFALGLRKKVVLTNLNIAFGAEKSAAEIERIAKDAYEQIGSQLFEFLMLYRVKPRDLSRFVTLEGAELITQALKQNKGALLAGNHFGHWELLSAAINTLGHPFYGYVGKQYNPFVDRFINRLRAKFGMQVIRKSKRATKEMLAALKKNQVLGILGDLNVPKQDLFVDLFGLKAAIGEGLATFVVKGNRPLFFIWIHRTGPLTHAGHIEPLDYQPLLTGEKTKDVQAVAQLIVNRLEENIKAYPNHYFWFNRRFKTRPEEEKALGAQIYDKMD